MDAADLAQIESNRLNNEKNLICIKAALRGSQRGNLAMHKRDNSGEAANYGLLLTNILLANILAMECMIRMWWTGNLAVLRSYMKWAE